MSFQLTSSVFHLLFHSKKNKFLQLLIFKLILGWWQFLSFSSKNERVRESLSLRGNETLSERDLRTSSWLTCSLFPWLKNGSDILRSSWLLRRISWGIPLVLIHVVFLNQDLLLRRNGTWFPFFYCLTFHHTLQTSLTLFLSRPDEVDETQLLMNVLQKCVIFIDQSLMIAT